MMDENIFIAAVAAVYADGITLNIGGEITEKHYKCNKSAVFSAGDIVKILKINGTFVVEYPIGNPQNF